MVGSKYSIAYVVNAAAGAEGDFTAATIVAGRKFKLRKVTFVFPAGSGFQLQLYVKRGEEKVVPSEGYIVGDNSVVSIECEVEFESESSVVVHYKNADSANAHSALVVLEGEVT
ncbi:MAG: hypothetical protein DRN91_09105 [Candidatus Alkanophagales archaeon]|nr:MAG: hypothetical protein DRN91_09105 [Candidatus Alkanophagales archaeon]